MRYHKVYMEMYSEKKTDKWCRFSNEEKKKNQVIQSSIVYEGFIGMVENRPLMRCIVTFNYSEMKYFPNVWKSNGSRWTIFRFYNITAHSTHDYTCEFKCNQVLNLRLALSTQPTAVSSFSSKIISRRANSNDIYIFLSFISNRIQTLCDGSYTVSWTAHFQHCIENYLLNFNIFVFTRFDITYLWTKNLFEACYQEKKNQQRNYVTDRHLHENHIPRPIFFCVCNHYPY